MCFWFWNKKIKLSCGLKIDENKVKGLPSKEIYEVCLSLMHDEFDHVFDFNTLSGWTLQWGDTLYKNGDGYITLVVSPLGHLCNGSTGGHTCKVAWRGCLHKSAFVHELIHALLKEAGGDLDADHDKKNIWDKEKKINDKLKNVKL